MNYKCFCICKCLKDCICKCFQACICKCFSKWMQVFPHKINLSAPFILYHELKLYHSKFLYNFIHCTLIIVNFNCKQSSTYSSYIIALCTDTASPTYIHGPFSIAQTKHTSCSSYSYSSIQYLLCITRDCLCCALHSIREKRAINSIEHRRTNFYLKNDFVDV